MHAGAASVMAPAVADPLLMGYKALYRTMLEDSKRGIARAVRVFAAPDAFPVLVHCIHGKDRTGLVIALLLMLCDVDPQVRAPRRGQLPWLSKPRLTFAMALPPRQGRSCSTAWQQPAVQVADWTAQRLGSAWDSGWA